MAIESVDVELLTDLVGDILARINITTVNKCIVSSKEMVKMMSSREYSLLFQGKHEDKPSKVLFMGSRNKEFKDRYHNVWIYNPTSGELRKPPRLATNFDRFVLMTMTRKYFLGSVSGLFKALAVTRAGEETTYLLCLYFG
ncbi:unnamed protein product [Arabis nemorensis]|uniref:Uncharacterized protein n=1 Tax=Arabis nemorensis TaxID=586526 RepID=A0A565CHN1_9BRAS|nr:unnamed protein product [Arabis nemorensis]